MLREEKVREAPPSVKGRPAGEEKVQKVDALSPRGACCSLREDYDAEQHARGLREDYDREDYDQCADFCVDPVNLIFGKTCQQSDVCLKESAVPGHNARACC